MVIFIEDAYILNTFKEAFLLPFFYNLIELNKFKEIDDLAKFVDIDNKTVKRVIDALTFFETIEKKYDIYRVCNIPKKIIGLSEDLNFKLYILNKFKEKIGDFPNWKKNAASFLIIEYLIKENQILVDTKDKILIESLNNYFKNVRQYIPIQKGKGEEINLNSTKLGHWCVIFEYLEFLIKVSSSQYILNISNDMILTLMKIYSIKIRDEILPLEEFFSWLNNNYFLMSRDGNVVPEILCKKLYSLVKQNHIKLIKSGDSQIMDLHNKPNYLNIPSIVNSIELLDV